MRTFSALGDVLREARPSLRLALLLEDHLDPTPSSNPDADLIMTAHFEVLMADPAPGIVSLGTASPGTPSAGKVSSAPPHAVSQQQA